MDRLGRRAPRPELGFMLDDAEMLGRLAHLYGRERAEAICREWDGLRGRGLGREVDCPRFDKPKVDRLWLETPDGKTAVELTVKSCDATRMTFVVPVGIAAGDYVLVAQRMNPDRRSFARARHKVRI